MKFYWHDCSWRSFIFPCSAIFLLLVSFLRSACFATTRWYVNTENLREGNTAGDGGRHTHKLIIITMKFLYQARLYRFRQIIDKHFACTLLMLLGHINTFFLHGFLKRVSGELCFDGVNGAKIAFLIGCSRDFGVRRVHRLTTAIANFAPAASKKSPKWLKVSARAYAEAKLKAKKMGWKIEKMRTASTREAKSFSYLSHDSAWDLSLNYI